MQSQRFNISAGPYRFALILSPSVGLEPAVRVLERRSAIRNPEKGSISAVWTVGDKRALGALQAIEAAGGADENIVITGIDANSQAREMIAKDCKFEASVARDFQGLGVTTAEAVKHQAHGRNRCTFNRLSPPSGRFLSGSRGATVG
jgi:ABC-type sugar transport system substrate-binding protein